ncbi:Hpt domain-containing protein [Vibrio sp. TH_r3]|uniref:Hpt domain-containing protein n=1 Tax=Vibrio sp. TH_r3 TaxID=3082084 RepID=UPI0029535C7E|nr:Hpt domain-containing protein [Vibrio sp. TH_r3]MDV7103114.1 Hpt domain-containing protein [Vibrio sp. TH_r3]
MITYLNSEKINNLCNEIGHDYLPTLLDIFLSELREYQLVINSGEDLQRNLSDISHALKSSAASFGADDLCDVAKQIDAISKTGQPVSTEYYQNLILTSLQATITAYEGLLS